MSRHVVRCGRGKEPYALQAPHLLHVFPSFAYGGVPIRIAGVINHFGRRYRHTVFALDGNHASASRLIPGLAVRLADPGIRKGRPLDALFAINRILGGMRPDLLLTYNWGAVEWALVNTIRHVAPHIHFESGFGPDEADRQIRRRVWARRIALRGARALVVPSQSLVGLARAQWRIDRKRIRYVPNGVDCALFDGPGDPAAIPAWRRPDRAVVVGTVAPLRAEKNLGRLLRAFARLPAGRDAVLLIVGDGAERAGLERLARDLDIADRVVFAGHVEAPHKVYPLLDVFVISSDTEQMPNTLIQAMAAARPVAAVDVGDVKIDLSPQNRPLVVDRSDEAGLAAAIDRLIADESLRTALGAANRAHVRAHYGLERMCAAYGALFDGALAERTPDARPIEVTQ